MIQSDSYIYIVDDDEAVRDSLYEFFSQRISMLSPSRLPNLFLPQSREQITVA
jgi:FixJ family two-component response regulator